MQQHGGSSTSALQAGVAVLAVVLLAAAKLDGSTICSTTTSGITDTATSDCTVLAYIYYALC
jgi:hypothetical protein